MTEIEWVDVRDRLPEIPDDVCGVPVLCTVFESYDGNYTVAEYSYLKTRSKQGVPISRFYEDTQLDADFMTLRTTLRGGYYLGEQWAPPMDEVIAWAYLPEPYKRKQSGESIDVGTIRGTLFA